MYPKNCKKYVFIILICVIHNMSSKLFCSWLCLCYGLATAGPRRCKYSILFIFFIALYNFLSIVFSLPYCYFLLVSLIIIFHKSSTCLNPLLWVIFPLLLNVVFHFRHPFDLLDCRFKELAPFIIRSDVFAQTGFTLKQQTRIKYHTNNKISRIMINFKHLMILYLSDIMKDNKKAFH